MEIPLEIQNLYRHWGCHTRTLKENTTASKIFTDEILYQEMSWFIHERISIWKKKVGGENPPYSDDKILTQYRFCNIFREFDRQTIVFHTLLNPLRDNFSLWLLNMFYCRMVARTETIEHVGLLSFDLDNNNMVYEKLMNHPRPRFGTPYVFPVSTILKSKTPTRELFMTKFLPTIMKEVANEIGGWDKKSVYDGLTRIIPIFGFNLHFLWTEVLIDVAYQFPEYIDLFARFPIGPGSLPTMNRVDNEMDPSLLVMELIMIPLDTDVTVGGKKLFLSAENWEGVGCEFRKYTNLKQGKGRKRVYNKKNMQRDS